MKRRLLIFSSLITLLLSCFSFPIFAEETVQDSSTIHTLSDGVFLDSYFYDNYDLLPYLHSTGNEYIDTDYIASDHLRIDITLSDITSNGYLFGSSNASQGYKYGIEYKSDLNNYLYFYNQNYSYPLLINPYELVTFSMDRNLVYQNNNLVKTFNNTSFSITGFDIYIFGRSYLSSINDRSNFKLYKFSIYDYSLNDGDGEYVRYYYPAKAKSSGAIGLYDAVNKTFVVSSSSVQFLNPTNEYVESFQISSFLTNSLTWIGQIFDAIIQMPIIIVFMAIGLAGAMFRWGRRIVHF